MTWKMEIHNKMKKQLNMCELSIHNGKVILIDSDKCYDKKMGKMLKTNDNKYVSKKVINNKKNKLYWRHLYSYLNEESIGLINQYIYKYKMKSEVLGIENIVYFNKNYDIENIVKEIYDCSLYNISYANNKIEYEKRMKKRMKEDWIEVDIEKDNIFKSYNEDKRIHFWKNNRLQFNQNIRDKNTKSKKIQKNSGGYCGIKYFDMFKYCNGIMGNGDLCGCESSEKLNIDRDYFNDNINHSSFNENGGEKCNRFKNSRLRNKVELSLCKIHYNKYNKMNEKKLNNEVDKIYKKMGYELQNGYLCKIC